MVSLMTAYFYPFSRGTHTHLLASAIVYRLPAHSEADISCKLAIDQLLHIAAETPIGATPLQLTHHRKLATEKRLSVS
jgi:hypothetical protein